MMAITHNICPYSLDPLQSLAEVDSEHIFPDAIGGGRDYCVRVAKRANSDLGSRIDRPLVDSFFIGALRLLHGIRSRSGRLEWRLQGEMSDTKQPVDVLLPEAGEMTIRFRKPVVMAEGGESGTIHVRPDERDAFLKELTANYGRKGRSVTITAESRKRVEAVHVPISDETFVLKRAIAKIAYVGAYECLGDAFLADPVACDWREVFMTDDLAKIEKVRIRGGAFDIGDVLKLVLPSMAAYEHGLVVANIGQPGPVVCVSLFGKGPHSMMFIASESTNFGLEPGEGKIAICDGTTRMTRFLDFKDHMQALSASTMFPGFLGS